MTTDDQLSELSDRELRRALSTAVAQEVARGWRIESQTDVNAILVRDKNDIAKLVILTVITAGLWWLGGWVFYRPKKQTRLQVQIDEFGQVMVTELS